MGFGAVYTEVDLNLINTPSRQNALPYGMHTLLTVSLLSLFTPTAEAATYDQTSRGVFWKPSTLTFTFTVVKNWLRGRDGSPC